MKRLLIALLLLLFAGQAEAKRYTDIETPWLNLTGVTVANLPTSPGTGDIARVTNGLTAADCTAGGGTDDHLCKYNGAAWVALVGVIPPAGAPTDATYITQTANGSLSGEQALSALSTGLLKNTTTTGILSIALAGTDYLSPSETYLAFNNANTNSSGGYQAGLATNGSQNTYFGYQAGQATTTATRNTAVGKEALEATTTGGYNTAVGREALKANIGGTRNAAFGAGSARYNTYGSDNYGLGNNAVSANIVGDRNVGNGTYALTAVTQTTTGAITAFADAGGGSVTVTSVGHGRTNGDLIKIYGTVNYDSAYYTVANKTDDTFTIVATWVADDATGNWYLATEGNDNTGVGYYSAGATTTGSNDVGIGSYSIYGNTVGSNLVGIGYEAGRYIADGVTPMLSAENSVYIGARSRGYSDSDDNSIVIGYQAIGSGANTTVIGNGSTTATYLKGTTYSTTFDTNVAAAGVTLSGTTLAADGTDANIDINITPKGTGTVNANITGSVAGNASTATALAANGADCSAGYSPLGVDASGAAESCWQVTPAAIGAIATGGNAGTATALAANGANCDAGSAPLGVDASGAAETCTDYEEDLANSAGLASAISDETGTGYVVYSAAPNLTGAITAGLTSTAASLAFTDSDVNHGITTEAPTDTWLYFTQMDANKGGGVIAGFSDAADMWGLELRGEMVSDPNDTIPAIMLTAYAANGTGTKAMGAGEIAVQIFNNVTPLTTWYGDGSILLGSAGVKISQDGDGAITFLGAGDGSDENLTINLDDTADTAVISSSTGVTLIDAGTIGFATTGIATAKIGVISKATSYTLGTDNAREAYGYWVEFTAAGTLTLPAIAQGMSVCVMTKAAVAVSIDANANDRIILTSPTYTVLDDGDKITNASTAGNFMCLYGDSANGWTTAGSSGTWTDGGP